MPAVTVDGVSLPFDDAGAGAAVVFVHGHPFDRSMWRPQLEHLAATGRRGVAPDLRGYGDATVVPGVTTLDVFARDVVGLMDHLELPDAVLVGLSMGGQIVLELYRLAPERVAGLVLADTSARAETPAGRTHRNDTADRLLREGMAPYAHEMLPRMVAPQHVAARSGVAEHVLGMMLATSPDGAAAALRGRAERPDYVALLERVTVPALVVVGDRDELTPLAEARLMHERVTGSRLAVIEGAGHLPNLERPDAFDAALDAFLDDHFA